MKRILFLALLATAAPLPAMADNYDATSSGAAATTTGALEIEGQTLDSSDIVKIQNALDRSGDYRGQVDGIWGPNTAEALRVFQEKNNLEVTGTLNSSTLDELDVQLSANAAGRISDTTDDDMDNTAGQNQ